MDRLPAGYDERKADDSNQRAYGKAGGTLRRFLLQITDHTKFSRVTIMGYANHVQRQMDNYLRPFCTFYMAYADDIVIASVYLQYNRLWVATLF
jgi:hypothetical protein